jgi:hypothetical protein
MATKSYAKKMLRNVARLRGHELRTMRTRSWIVEINTLAVLALAAPAQASSPTASCIGQ